MPFTLTTKEAMLRSQLSGPLLIGLLKPNGQEEDDANYQQQEVVFDAASPTDQLANITEVRFPPYAMRSRISGWIVYTMSGAEIGREPLAVAKHMDPRERVLFAPGDLVIGFAQEA